MEEGCGPLRLAWSPTFQLAHYWCGSGGHGWSAGSTGGSGPWSRWAASGGGVSGPGHTPSSLHREVGRGVWWERGGAARTCGLPSPPPGLGSGSRTRSRNSLAAQGPHPCMAHVRSERSLGRESGDRPCCLVSHPQPWGEPAVHLDSCLYGLFM